MVCRRAAVAAALATLMLLASSVAASRVPLALMEEAALQTEHNETGPRWGALQLRAARRKRAHPPQSPHQPYYLSSAAGPA
jgi:hypothetical protein